MNIKEAVKKLQALSYEDQLKHLDFLSAFITENEWTDLKVQIELFSKGMVSEIKPPRSGRIGDFTPIKIEGEPLSEDIIRNRR